MADIQQIAKLQEKNEEQVKSVTDFMAQSPITFADSGLKIEATFEEKLAVFEVCLLVFDLYLPPVYEP